MDSTVTILTILVTVIGVIGFLQLVVLFMMFLGVKKGMKEMSAHAGDFKARINPLIDETREVMTHTKVAMEYTKGVLDQTRSVIAKLEPKLEMAATDLADITHTASEEAHNLQKAATEVSDRVRRQALRIESLSNRTLDGVDRAGHFVGAAVTSPFRQFSGIVAAAKAIVDTLKRPAPGSGSTHSSRASAPPRPAYTGTPISEERSGEKREERSYYTGPEARSR